MPRARYVNALTHPATLPTGRTLAPGESVETESTADMQELVNAGLLFFVEFLPDEPSEDSSTSSLSILDESEIGSHSIKLGDPAEHSMDAETVKQTARRSARRKGGDGS